MTDESAPHTRRLLAEVGGLGRPTGADEARIRASLSNTLGMTLAAAKLTAVPLAAPAGVGSAAKSAVATGSAVGAEAGGTAAVGPVAPVASAGASAATIGSWSAAKIVGLCLLLSASAGAMMYVRQRASTGPAQVVASTVPTLPQLVEVRHPTAVDQGVAAAAPALAPSPSTSPSGSAEVALELRPSRAQPRTSRRDLPLRRHESEGPVGSSSMVSSAMSDELAELAEAQRALGHGQAQLALEHLQKHQRGFPRSHFSEERDALGIVALCALGRVGEAEAKAQLFRSAHPHSIFEDRLANSCVARP